MTTTLDRKELEDLKARVDLVDLFRDSGLQPRKKGKNWLCHCPFHDDREASLSINNERRLWQCFSCKAAGDAFDFLRLKEKMDFPAALERLRRCASAEPSAPLPTTKELPGGFRRQDLLNRVSELYQRRFAETTDGKSYLESRGISMSETWKAFQVGFCDGSLLKTLPEEGPIVEALQSIGLLNSDKKELFRGCVVVPLTHPDLGIVGLYGRRIRPDAKNRHLYLPGPHQGVLNWQSFKSSSGIVLTESVLDAMAVWQAGVRNVSCLYGTQGLPEPLKELLVRFEVRELLLALDGDRAGLEATQTLSQTLREMDRTVTAVRLPDGQDPAQILQDQGPEALQKLLTTTPKEAPSPPVSPTSRMTSDKGFEVQLTDTKYRVEMIGPFSSRLKANVLAHHSSGRWTQDRIDFYVHRDRAKLERQLVSQLQLSRTTASQHVAELMAAAEDWAKDRKAPEKAENETVQLTEQQRQEALAFLRKPQLARAILADLENLGYIGEENPKLLAYLIGVSRKLPKPLSGIIISQSGCGKSTLTDFIEQLTPPEDVMMFTRITAQALQYMAQFLLKGKLIIVEERTGAESAEYSIRILQSRQKLTQAVPQKDPATGKIATQIITVEGPVAYLETTTDPRINHENATRCFEITLDESQEQTERILAAQRAGRMPTRKNPHRQAETIRERHHNAHRLLEPVLVFIPFADQLVFPSKKLRNRRDHERFLCLIEASAFLHQYQRERGKTEDGDDYVMASLDDYRLAYQLAHEVLSLTLHELSRGAKDLWQLIRAWVHAQADDRTREFLFTRRDLRRVTDIEDHQLRAALQELVDMEYVEVAAGQNGRAYQYRLLVAHEQEAPVALLSPEDLERRLSS